MFRAYMYRSRASLPSTPPVVHLVLSSTQVMVSLTQYLFMKVTPSLTLFSAFTWLVAI